MAMELSELKPSDNNNEEDEGRIEVCPGNGSCSNHNTPDAPEDSRLLSDPEVVDSNGVYSIYIEDDQSGPSPKKPRGAFGRLRSELNEPVCGKFKVWMLILLCFILIVLVILSSIYFCSVNQEDVDEKYDKDEFVVPRIFVGHFTLLNKTITLDAQSQSTSPLLGLKEKLTQIFTSSYALGRYFSLATVNQLSNSSIGYELEFKMPEEHNQLMLYTLSREMVYNVLLQQLFDQDTGDPLYIEETSLTMEGLLAASLKGLLHVLSSVLDGSPVLVTVVPQSLFGLNQNDLTDDSLKLSQLHYSFSHNVQISTFSSI